MKRGFTLIELLVVIGIMGLLGTVSVAGYRAMQRGMEERGVMQNVNELIKAAYERAQIDRQPTAIYFWNETLRSSDEEDNEIVVGRAVAVRRQGRLSRVAEGILFDEFSDLNKTYPTTESGDSESDENANGDGSADAGDNTMYLYYLDNPSGGALRIQRSVVSQRVDKENVGETYLNGIPSDSTGSGGNIEVWGFKVEDAGGVDWRAGSSYGVEFAELTLPHGYIFGNGYSTDVKDPVREAGTMLFKVGRNTGNGVSGGSTVEGSITVYSLRPNASGSLSAQPVNDNDNPY